MGAREQLDGAPAVVAVLAGGRGSRLGADKALAQLGGRPLIDHPLQAALAAGLPAIVVAKSATVLPALEVEVVVEPDEPVHPLSGVVAALTHLAHVCAGAGPRAIVAVGCDMPFVAPGLLRALAELDVAAAAPVLEGQLRPLPARYRLDTLAALRGALAQESSMRATLGALGAVALKGAELSAHGDPGRVLWSVNEAADLERARALLAG